MAMNGKSDVRKMFSKEECEIALENAVDTGIIKKDWNVLNQLIEEHFKLKEKYSKILDDVHDYRFETHCMKMTIRNLCKHFGVKNEKELQNIYLNKPYKPYKFEDLKPNMWVWDNVAKECLYVVRPFITTGVRVKYFTCLGIWNLEKIKKLNMEFEENRFFPVQYAHQFL
ncbi:hypothetical protein [Thomasclavelia ramosa]|jgi:hypothetical protein|uniref:hypothetical protein n=1 Tax=Thomasclavelia ramosa TaxID=1547 RepID=UPI0001A279EB|nr:hypothetical protein MBAG_03089 [Coprobacillus sp. D7]MDU4735701.1 hypothetical protein [Thomasclavelia ramosa]